MQDIDLKRREILIAAGAAAGAAELPMQASAQAPIIIKFSHVVAVDTPKGKGAEKFKELAEKRLGNKVKIELYPNSTLYKDGEELEALSLGSVQLLAPSLAKFGPLGAREFEVFDLPYMFDDSAELHNVTEGPAGKALFKKLESKGIKGLAYWDNGFKIMTSNKPMKTPADMPGQNIHVPGLGPDGHAAPQAPQARRPREGHRTAHLVPSGLGSPDGGRQERFGAQAGSSTGLNRSPSTPPQPTCEAEPSLIPGRQAAEPISSSLPTTPCVSPTPRLPRPHPDRPKSTIATPTRE